MMNTSIMGTPSVVMGPQKIVSQGILEKLCLKVLSSTAGDVIMCSWGMFLRIEQ